MILKTRQITDKLFIEFVFSSYTLFFRYGLRNGEIMSVQLIDDFGFDRRGVKEMDEWIEGPVSSGVEWKFLFDGQTNSRELKGFINILR